MLVLVLVVGLVVRLCLGVGIDVGLVFLLCLGVGLGLLCIDLVVLIVGILGLIRGRGLGFGVWDLV